MKISLTHPGQENLPFSEPMAPEPQGLKLRPAAGRDGASSVWLRSLRPPARYLLPTAFFVKTDDGPNSKLGEAGGGRWPATPCRKALGVWPEVTFYAKRRPAGGSGPAAGDRDGEGRTGTERAGPGATGTERRGRPPGGLLPPAGPCSALEGVRGAKSRRRPSMLGAEIRLRRAF